MDNKFTLFGRVICAATGTVLAGPVGGLIGNLVGGTLATLLPVDPGLSSLVSDKVGDFTGEVFRRAGESISEHTTLVEQAQIRSYLQEAFRDSLRDALYDIGGEPCFTLIWKKGERQVPEGLIFPLTPEGNQIWRSKNPLAIQIGECLQHLDDLLAAGTIISTKSGSNVDIQQYLESSTQGDLSEKFFDNTIAPYLSSYRTLFIEIPELDKHLRRHLVNRALVHLNKILVERPETWRSLMRLMLGEMRNEVIQLGQGQSDIVKRLDALASWPLTLENLSKILSGALETIGQTQAFQSVKLDTVFEQLTQHNINISRVIERIDKLITISYEYEHLDNKLLGMGQSWNTNFFKGSEPTWLDIANENDSHRDLLKKILTVIGSFQNQPSFLLISGEPGSGKSTLLKRIAVELYRENREVLFHHKSRNMLSIEVIRDLYHSLRSPIYVLIDDVFRKQNSQGFLSDLGDLGLPIFVIATSRLNEREESRANLIKLTDTDEYGLGTLTTNEIESLCDKLVARGELLIHNPDTLAHLKKAFMFESQLLVVMARLVGGSDFQTIVREEHARLNQLDKTFFHTYNYTCAFYWVGVAISVSLLSRLVGVREIYGTILNRPEVQGILLFEQNNNRLVKARHELVAEIVVSTAWPRKEQLEDIYVTIIKEVRANEDSERIGILSLFRGLLSHRQDGLARNVIRRVESNLLESYLSQSSEQELIAGWSYLFYSIGEPILQEKCYHLAIEKFPESSNVHLAYAQFLEMFGCFDQAEEQYFLAFQLETGSTKIANIYASFLIDQKRLEEAARVLEDALASSPNDEYLALTFARLLIEKGEDEKAEEYYKVAIESNPKDSYARVVYARFLVQHARLVDALSQLEAFLKIRPVAQDVLGLFISYCRLANQPARAIERIKSALDANPRNMFTWQSMISFLSNSGDDDQAIDQAKASIVIDPKNPTIRRLYINSLIKKEYFDEAVKQFIDYFKLVEGTIDEHLLLLNLLRRSQVVEKHESYYRETLQKLFELFLYQWQNEKHTFRMPPVLEIDEQYLSEITDETPVVLLFQYMYYVGHNGPDKAEHVFLKLINQMGKDEENEQLRIRILARLHKQRSETARSLELLHSAVERWPSRLWPHVDLMFILQEQNLTKELQYEVKYLTENFPAYLPARISNLNSMILSGDIVAAEDELKSLIELEPRDTGLRNLYLHLLIQQERHIDGIKQCQEILKINPEDVGTRRTLIKFLRLRGSGEEKEHIEFLEKVGISTGRKTSNLLFETRVVQVLDEATLRQKIAVAPTATGLINQLIQLLERNGRIDEALRILESSLLVKTPPRASLRRLYATFLSRHNQIEKADEQFQIALQEHPEKPGNYISYALFLDKLGHPSDAKAQLQQGQENALLTLAPKRLTALAGLEHALGNIELAERFHRLALIVDDSDPVSHLNVAIFLNDIGRTDQAEIHLKKAIELKGDFIAARQAYGILLGKERRDNEALQQFEQLISIGKNNLPVICGYANFLVERKPIKGWAKRAEELYKHALSIDSNHIQSRISYALLLKRQKRNQEADEQFRAVVDKNNQDYHARHAYGVFLKEIGKYDKSIEQLEKAFDPHLERHKSRLHNAMVHNAYADVLRENQASPDEIISHYEKALAIEPIDRQSRFHLMLTHKAFAEYLCRNNKKAAIGEFESALEFEPDNSYIRNSYARCLESHGDNNQAFDQYKKVIEKFPDEIHALGGIAKLLSRQGRFKDAHEYFEHALKLDQNNFHILFPYGNTIIRELEQNDFRGTNEELLKRAHEIVDQLKRLAPTDKKIISLSARLDSILPRQ